MHNVEFTLKAVAAIIGAAVTLAGIGYCFKRFENDFKNIYFKAYKDHEKDRQKT
jgi:hypothetical protein